MKTYPLFAILFLSAASAYAAPVLSCKVSSGDGDVIPTKVEATFTVNDSSEVQLANYGLSGGSLYTRKELNGEFKGKVFISLAYPRQSVTNAYDYYSFLDEATMLNLECSAL